MRHPIPFIRNWMIFSLSAFRYLTHLPPQCSTNWTRLFIYACVIFTFTTLIYLYYYIPRQNSTTAIAPTPHTWICAVHTLKCAICHHNIILLAYCRESMFNKNRGLQKDLVWLELIQLLKNRLIWMLKIYLLYTVHIPPLKDVSVIVNKESILEWHLGITGNDLQNQPCVCLWGAVLSKYFASQCVPFVKKSTHYWS